MNRQDFQDLAEMRLKDAEALLQAGQHPGAYYMAGYAIECGLKACIAKLTQQYDYPDKKRVNDSYCHSLVTLLKVADLDTSHQATLQSYPAFAVNWGVVKDWSEQDRYDKNISQQDAADMLTAINDPAFGILQWLKSNW